MRLLRVLVLLGSVVLGDANAAPTDCVGASVDGRTVCLTPEFGPTIYHACIANSLSTTEAASTYCGQQLGIRNPVYSEAPWIAHTNCVFNRLNGQGSVISGFPWLGEGGTVSSYQCYSGTVKYRWGLELVGYSSQQPSNFYAVFSTRHRTALCRPGETSVHDTAGELAYCVPPISNSATCSVGNPVQVDFGVKVEHSGDYQGAGAHPLNFERSYRSWWYQGVAPAGMGPNWTHNWSSRVGAHEGNYLGVRYVFVQRSDGQIRIFAKKPATTSWIALANARDTLAEQLDSGGTFIGWQFKLAEDDSTENYDNSGKLTSLVSRNGWTATLSYSTAATPASVAPKPGLLISVRNHFGRELRFLYDAQGRLVQLLPPGAVEHAGAGATSPIRYAYNETASLGPVVPAIGQLTSVTWQDGSVRRYHHEMYRSDFPVQAQLLTGITDEAGVRYASFSYYDAGKVLRTEHVGGVDRVDFGYPGAEYSGPGLGVGPAIVTDYAGPSGSASSRTYQFVNIGNTRYPASVSAPCPLCGSTNRNSTYDSVGNLTKSIGHDGKPTFYQYDAKRHEIERATFASSHAAATTRPALSAAESVTSTSWHATFNLPAQIVGPRRYQGFTYDAKGNITLDSDSETTDATGATKWSAVRIDSTRQRTYWSYNTSSLPTTIRQTTGGDGNGVGATETGRWTPTYNGSGDLTRITETATGKVAQAISYDAHGALTAGTSLDGAAVAFTYNSRGHLTEERYDSMITTYARNAIGLPTSVATPSTTLTVSYDPAERVSAVNSDIRFPQSPTTSMRRAFLGLPEWVRRHATALIPSAHAQSAVQRAMPIGGVLSPRSDRANRGAWDDLAGPRPMTLAEQCTAALSSALSAVGSAIGSLTKAETCSEEPPTPGGKDCDDRCKKWTNRARSQYHKLVTKRIPVYLSGGARGSDARHYQSIKELQQGLANSAQRVRLYCNPLPVELPEWERAAALTIPILH